MFHDSGNGNGSEASTSNAGLSQSCCRFEFYEILLATQNFNDSLVVGKGGFGKVYKGKIRIGTTHVDVAIKRMDLMSNQGAAEFWAEVEMLTKLRHAHLVSLIGYCNHEEEMILVYEYMPSGTLEDHLYKLHPPLSWLERLKICVGAARGLDYLHTGTGIEVGVIHRDVKTSNILIHESWAAKISDFGLARIGPINQPSTYVNTLVKGTFGYIDPNYFATGKLTRKSDVYAFGVVLFEVLCQKRPLDRSFECGLVTWIQESIKEGNLKQIVYPGIRNEISLKCLKGFARIAERCLDFHPNQRPTMTEVVFSLESLLAQSVSFSQQKTNNWLLPPRKKIFGRIFDVFPSSSPVENSGPVIFSPWIKAKELKFLEEDNLFLGLEKVGRGGCGEVFKAHIRGGIIKTIAIKRIITQPSELIEEDEEPLYKNMGQIQSEIQTVGQIRHRNLLSLLAHVSRPTCHYLVYEYIKNGSLQDMFQPVHNGRRELDWLTRHKIAIGVASGLEHLHTSHTPRIVHRDLKPGNVLLDDDMVARIADFGLSELISDADTHVTYSFIGGTLGYIAPEYFQTLKFSEKCDIYSFGMILGVLVVGKLPSDEFFQHTDEMSMVRWMRNVMTSDDPRKAIDPILLGNGYEKQMLLVLKIACFCTMEDPKERPNSMDCRIMLSQIQH
uniref:putative cysteine-rich receptor-like protein kinase 23 n=1 Tax=Erigeron canadensis TaxID=72917 RepID=UPI001CB8F03F|nr:putative cysteine-rich receptor-like protein kinase 23 [Erigeron canadensis]XP_043635473.1 putative cysteine-rich receptor-like protein kinase 23 [Erigeron canadensis]